MYKQEMSAPTSYAAICPVAPGLRCRQSNRPNIGLQSAPAALDPPALPPVSKDDARFLGFTSPVTLTLTFRTENWHSNYSCRGESLCWFWFFCFSLFLSYEPVRDRRTDGRAWCLMHLINDWNNNKKFNGHHFRINWVNWFNQLPL